jgi:flagellar motor protein MotB
MLVNFSISVDRAEAVTRELIRLGAPPGSVLTEARGDSDPVYYEVMPAGEQENRRAEVFLEF